MKITAIYKTDFHHSYNSRDLIGLYTNKAKLRSQLMKIIKEDQQDNPNNFETKTEERNHINWLFSFLMEKHQTQGLSNFEIVIEELEANELF